MENQNQGSIYQQPPAAETTATQIQVKYAGFWIRWVANFIDGLVLIVPNLIAGLIIKFATFGVAQQVLTSVSGLLVSWIYFILMTNKYQATLGKKAFGLMVVSDKAESLTLGQVILRETIGKLISMIILFIGYIMAGFTQRKQALHDKIASTTVIYRDPNKKLSGGMIALIIIACILPFFAIIGIFASIVLVSLNSARGKAQDAAIKATLSSMIPDAIIYEDENSSYKGYKVPSDISAIACSGQPIINISTDGKQMAIFMKSCGEDSKYFCGNPETTLVTETAAAGEDYVKSGATICNPSDVPSDNLDSEDISKDSDLGALSNTFKDDSLGYGINYPSGWVQQKEADSETGITTIAFSPDKANPSAIVYIQSIAGQQAVTSEALDAFIKSVQGELVKAGGKTYDEKDFIYTYEDGTKSTGKAFKAEYSDSGMNVKQWLIAIPNGKKLHWLTYVSDVNQYDSNYDTALAMIESWKISK